MLFEDGTPLLLLLNGGGRSRAFALPERPKAAWTSWSTPPTRASGEVTAGLTLAPHSLVLLRHA